MSRRSSLYRIINTLEWALWHSPIGPLVVIALIVVLAIVMLRAHPA